MNLKVKGIVLKSTEYKESDKLLTILTLEQGKILVKARGVKKAKSKLKAYAQSFCFADFELEDSKSGFILTGVNEIENFFDLTTNMEKFEYAFCVLEIADKICKEGQEYPLIFLDTLKCLKQIYYSEKTDVRLFLIKYMLNILNFEGINLDLKRCNNCKSCLLNDIYLDMNTGEILCNVCKTFDSEKIEKSTYSALKMINDCSYDRLETIKLSKHILITTFNIVLKNLCYKFEIKLNSILTMNN